MRTSCTMAQAASGWKSVIAASSARSVKYCTFWSSVRYTLAPSWGAMSERAARVDLAPRPVLLAQAHPRAPLQQMMVALLDPRAADAFEIGKADDVAGQLLLRIMAGADRLEPHPRQLQRRHALHDVVRHLRLDQLVLPPRPVRPLEHPAGVQAQHRRQARADRLRGVAAGDHVRRHHHVLQRQVQRQQIAVAVQDAPPPRVKIHPDAAPLPDALPQGLVVPEMQLNQPDGQDAPRRQDEDGHRRHPPHGAAFNHARPGCPAGRTAPVRRAPAAARG